MTATFASSGHGLTEGLSSKIMRATRPTHWPSLMLLHQTNADLSDALHGRLEELLVFEILKEGNTSYKRFTVRTLYKYVIKAIRTESYKNDKAPTTNRSSMAQLALGRAIVGMGPAFIGATERNADENDQTLESLDCLIQASSAESNGTEAKVDAAPDMVAGRKRLGGFLHPRDMRKLVTPFSASNEPELIVRRHAMLLNFDPLRAIILRDRAIVLVPDGADSLLVQLENRILGKDTSPFCDYRGTMQEGAPSLSKLHSTAESATDNRDVSGTVDMEADDDDNDEWKLSLIDMEWADLDAKGWIDLPFELQCVDAVLSSVSSTMAEDVLELQLGANTIITELVANKADDGDLSQETLRTMKNSVREMISRVQGFNRAIDTVLEDYEDLALMNLSRLLTHPERFVQPVPQTVLEEESDEPELILEAHVQQGHTLINALALVEGQINSTEDYANRKSDTIRNQLLYVNTVTSILTLAVGVGAFVGSLFGMNVTNHYEDASNAFRIIVFTTLAVMILISAIPLLVLPKIGALNFGSAGPRD